MKNLLLSAAMLSAFASSAHASREAGTEMLQVFSESAPASLAQDADFKPVNWAQPPLGCVEEMVPHRADRPCLDLSSIANPMKDWPTNLSPEDQKYWYAQRRGINICRAEEVLRREKAQPGSMNPSHVELGWMAIDSLRNQQAKVSAIYEASRQTGVPLHVLTGAVYQESLFSELGIADDGGNFSCGVEQINLIGWCGWMNKQSAADKQAMGWPTQTVACENSNIIKLSLFRPIFEIAKTRLNGLPEYRLNKSHFANIPLESFVSKWPAATPQVQQLRYQLIRSYVENCSDASKGILAKAHELAGIYNTYVSSALKNKDRYARGESFSRACRTNAPNNAYPLHTGWLLTVSAYNAGPRSIDAVAHYNNWTKAEMNDPRMVADFTPNDIVTSLYWAGRYNPSNDLIEFNGLNGSLKNWTWFKGCVAQRHIARVMQHVTLLPEFFVDTLEGSHPCGRSTFDSNGNLIKTAVPEERQHSSGHK
jgi:hypothetical protein